MIDNHKDKVVLTTGAGMELEGTYVNTFQIRG